MRRGPRAGDSLWASAPHEIGTACACGLWRLLDIPRPKDGARRGRESRKTQGEGLRAGPVGRETHPRRCCWNRKKTGRGQRSWATLPLATCLRTKRSRLQKSLQRHFPRFKNSRNLEISVFFYPKKRFVTLMIIREWVGRCPRWLSRGTAQQCPRNTANVQDASHPSCNREGGVSFGVWHKKQTRRICLSQRLSLSHTHIHTREMMCKIRATKRKKGRQIWLASLYKQIDTA